MLQCNVRHWILEVREDHVMHKPPKKFFETLAIGAPTPCREIPTTLERTIHFFPPHLEKICANVPDIVAQDDGTWKQAKVIADLARMVVAKDPDMAATYGL